MTRSAADRLRTVRLTPYRRGLSLPTFTLIVWSTNETDRRGQTRLAYQLRQHDAGRTSIVFDGSDFCGSPLHADDSDQTIGSLLGFLTLRPGDTDREFFRDYTQAQWDFCEQHAESLSAEVYARFGDV